MFYYDDGITLAPAPATYNVWTAMQAQYNNELGASDKWTGVPGGQRVLYVGSYGDGAPKGGSVIYYHNDLTDRTDVQYYYNQGASTWQSKEHVSSLTIWSSYGDSNNFVEDKRTWNLSELKRNCPSRQINIQARITLDIPVPSVAATYVPQQENAQLPANIAQVAGNTARAVLKNGNWECVFSELPVLDSYGNTHTYYVREEVAKVTGDGVTASYTYAGSNVGITNTVSRTQTTSLEVAKEWRDAAGDKMAAWPSGQTIALKLSGMLEGSSQQTFRTLGETGNDTLLTFEGIAPGMTAITREVGGATLILTCATEGEGDSAVHRIRIEGLPPTDGTTAWVYYFEESPVSGYLTSYENEGASTMPGACDGGTIINALAPYVLPSTGGPGTTLYTFTGLSVMLFALASLLRKRRYYSDHQN